MCDKPRLFIKTCIRYAMPTHSSVRATLLLALSSASQTLAACSCASYNLNATNTPEHAIFTETLETDFTQPNPSLTWDSTPGLSWQAQTYNVTPAAARGSYGKAAELSNVVLNPQGQGLELWVRSQVLESMLPIAEIATGRTDVLYGSFRVGMKTTAVNGTCGAFFFYHDDSQEIDVEVLSRQQGDGNNTVNLVLQSPASQSAGFDAAGTPGFVPYGLGFDPTAEFHEYRYDWLPGRVDMYVDGAWLHSFYDGIPDSPGAIHLIHWSNGDPGWSGGPPTEDAVLTVSYVKAYFNSSSGPSQCLNDQGTAVTDTCNIPADGQAPQPTLRPSVPSGTSSAGPTGSAAQGGAANIGEMKGLVGMDTVAFLALAWLAW
ncbi:hypothetical protein LTR10_006995 [Elasticomyces elasticus]|nr:hypothetical protein LTR10_006995 [Elasticomyces elasticus]KAK4978813.1 hypothetical protein LTR42_001313 [Elasticomyces elasticus]